MTEDTRGFATINGAQLYYEIAGEGDVLVLLHGHLLSCEQWDEQFDRFRYQYRVLRYDARGYGRSELPPGPFAHRDDLRDLLTQLGIERAALVGCSGGGEICIDFTIEHPERVTALLTLGGALSGFEWSEPRPALLTQANEAYDRGDLEAAVEYGLRYWVDGGRAPEQVDPMVREQTRIMMRHTFALPDGDEQEIPLDPPAAGRLSEISCPTLAIVGAEDGQRFHAIADLIASQVPGARKLVIDDAGHHPNMEHPAEFDHALLRLLTGMTGRRGERVTR